MDTQHTLDFWKEKFWAVEKCPWHLREPHVGLLKYGDELFQGKKSRVLLPLCGKTIDLKWLYDQGHTVVGAEGCVEPIIEFFNESGLNFNVTDNSYQTTDGRLTILHGNFFEMKDTFNGSFDTIWDRAALVAVEPQHRDLYAQTVKRLTKDGARLLLVTTEYNQTKVQGPPWSITDEDIKSLYGPWATLKILTQETQSPDRNEYINDKFIRNGVSINQSIYLLEKN